MDLLLMILEAPTVLVNRENDQVQFFLTFALYLSEELPRLAFYLLLFFLYFFFYFVDFGWKFSICDYWRKGESGTH